MEHLWVVLGRLHPVAVHLPIGGFVVLALVELAAAIPGLPRLPDAQRRCVLAFGAVGSLVTALFGWLLAREGGYDAQLLDRHQMLGFSVAALATILLAADLRRWRRTYGALLAATVLAVAVTGHLGGSLTHGEDYLTPGRAKTARVAPANVHAAHVFDHVIHPILQQRCAGCHGATKSNGDLRLDSFAQLMQGGKSGPAVAAGDPGRSRIIQRVHLPIDAKEHMPPKGKPQLSEDDIAVLEWWIAAGASGAQTVAEAAPPPEMAGAIARRLGVPPPPLPDRSAMLAAANALERQLDIVIRPLAADGPWLAANARLRLREFGDAELAQLAPIAPALQWLDLGETAVTDAGLQALRAMTNLRRLQLDRTGITDAGIGHLAGLVQLESLNLHGTRVTDTSLDTLRPLSRLRSLYAWQTGMTPDPVAKFGEQQVNRGKIDRWKAEVAALEAKIGAEQFRANLGERLAVPPAPETKAKPRAKKAPPD